MSHIEPEPEQFKAFIAADLEGPVTMLNLLRYLAEADYAGHPEQAPCSGRDAYRRYAAAALEHINRVGGRVVFAGAALQHVIGPGGERWDDALLVEYPDRDAFMEMVSSSDYQAITFHRRAALADSRLLPLRAGQASFQS